MNKVLEERFIVAGKYNTIYINEQKSLVEPCRKIRSEESDVDEVKPSWNKKSHSL
jgi:hypothetical protein